MNMTISWRALVRVLGLSGVALLVTACAGLNQPARLLPEEQGLYASSGEQLVRLNGSPEWETKTWSQRSNLGPRTDFVIYHPAVALLSGAEIEGAIKLEQVSWVRSEVAADGSITPVQANSWATSRLEAFRVPLDFQRVDLRRDMLVAIPARPLQPGLYSLQFRTAEGVYNTRVGIGWPTVNRKDYAAATCVDRYPGSEQLYRQCGQQQVAAASGGLNLYLVTPQAIPSPVGRAMVIQGVIVNDSDSAQTVPLLSGYLHRNDGQVLRRWQFAAPAAQIGPGESITFRSEVPDPPAGAHSVRVRFDGEDDALRP
jgi:hypothetical protein